MPVDTRINVPFIPQEGITSQILTAIQLANENHARQQQLALQQQQTDIATQKAPAEVEEAKARAGYYGSEAQKNQLDVDMRRRAQQMFSGAAPAQSAPQQNTAPSVQQQVQMYPGSDLAKAVSADPASFTTSGGKEQWLPTGTPPQLAPLVSAMIPSDLTDQEKNVIEGGAQAGAMKAQQNGDLAGYLNEIRSGVDAVVQNRNKVQNAPENQPVSDKDRDNFLKNVLPSFENLTAAQVKGAQGELAGLKDQKGLQQLEGRLMQQDNQALQKQIAEKNLRANKEIAHGQALDLSGRNKVVADTQKWGDAFTQAQTALKTIDAAQNGDDLATRMLPTMEVLGINMQGGIRRISPTEYEAARIPVSWANQFNQWVDSKTSGSTSPEMVSEGKRLMHQLTDVKYGEYLSEVKSTASNFNLDPKSVYVMDNNGDSVSLSDALKSKPKAASTASPSGLQVGQTVSIRGKEMKVTAVHPDGTFDAQ